MSQDNDSSSNGSPIVSIGLPVYNGQNYLEEAIESILSQTFTDFEVILCDNASTDRTAEICERFAQRDSRIRYYRNKENVGAAGNFNLTVKRSNGKYFKWCAHDDICGPDFLSACVKVLDESPDVVLAYPKAYIIDEASNKREPYKLKLKTDSPSECVRFRELLTGHRCYEVFGLIRKDALLDTNLIGAYSHGDEVLLVELALRGRFHEIPEFHFYPRRHPAQSMSMLKDRKRYSEWFDPNLKSKKLLPHWRVFFEFLRTIRQGPVKVGHAIRMHFSLARWFLRNWRAFASDIVRKRS